MWWQTSRNLTQLKELYAAIEAGDVKRVDTLLGHVVHVNRVLPREIDPDSDNWEESFRYGDTLLHVAARQGDVGIVKLLLDRGADCVGTDCAGGTPLHGAAQSQRGPVVDLLLDRGAPINRTNFKRRTALHGAAVMARTDMVRLLLDRGADIDALDADGRTALYTSLLLSLDGYLETMQLLLDRGAAIHAADAQGRTPLHVAAASGLLPAVKLLIECGADVNRNLEQTQSPLDLAQGSPRIAYSPEHQNIVKLLQTKGAQHSQAPPTREPYADFPKERSPLTHRRFFFLVDAGMWLSTKRSGCCPTERWLSSWNGLKAQKKVGDQLWFSTSSPRMWKMRVGGEGYYLVRKGKIIASLMTRMN